MKFKSFLHYLKNRKNAHGIHSPYVFEFYNEVLKKAKHTRAGIASIYASKCKREGQEIERNDLGAGSKYLAKKVKVSKIARIAGSSIKYGKLLNRINEHYHYKNVLELGTSIGIGTAFLADNDATESVTTIEGCPQTAKYVLENFPRELYHKLKIEVGDFDAVLPKIKETFDLIYVDGNHTKNATLRYFHTLKDKLNLNGLLIFDDIHWNHEMEEAWDEIRKNEEVAVSIDLFRLGIISFRNGQRKEDFILKY